MAWDALINGAFGLGGALVGVGTTTWSQHRMLQSQQKAWERSVVSDAQRRLVMISALGRTVPNDDEKMKPWRNDLDRLIDEIEVAILVLPAADVRARIAEALGFMRYCDGYADQTRHFGDRITIEGVLRITTGDIKQCLANYSRSEESPPRPDRYRSFDEVDAYQEEMSQLNEEAEEERRAELRNKSN